MTHFCDFPCLVFVYIIYHICSFSLGFSTFYFALFSYFSHRYESVSQPVTSWHTASNIRNALLSLARWHSSAAKGASLLLLPLSSKNNWHDWDNILNFLEAWFCCLPLLGFFLRKLSTYLDTGFVYFACPLPLPHLLHAGGDSGGWNTVKDWKKFAFCVAQLACKVFCMLSGSSVGLSTSSAVCSQL